MICRPVSLAGNNGFDLGLEALIVALNDLNSSLNSVGSGKVGHLHRDRFATEEITVRITGEDNFPPQQNTMMLFLQMALT